MIYSFQAATAFDPVCDADLEHERSAFSQFGDTPAAVHGRKRSRCKKMMPLWAIMRSSHWRM